MHKFTFLAVALVLGLMVAPSMALDRWYNFPYQSVMEAYDMYSAYSNGELPTWTQQPKAADTRQDCRTPTSGGAAVAIPKDTSQWASLIATKQLNGSDYTKPLAVWRIQPVYITP